MLNRKSIVWLLIISIASALVFAYAYRVRSCGVSNGQLNVNNVKAVK